MDIVGDSQGLAGECRATLLYGVWISGSFRTARPVRDLVCRGTFKAWNHKPSVPGNSGLNCSEPDHTAGLRHVSGRARPRKYGMGMVSTIIMYFVCVGGGTLCGINSVCQPQT